jgi:hypothetical protein
MTDLYYLNTIGILAVVGSAACYLAAYECRWKRYWRKEAGDCLAMAEVATDQRDTWRNIAAEAQSKLDAQASKRSANVAKGNHTRALKAKALRDATTAQLAGEVRAKARKLRVAA